MLLSEVIDAIPSRVGTQGGGGGVIDKREIAGRGTAWHTALLFSPHPTFLPIHNRFGTKIQVRPRQPSETPLSSKHKPLLSIPVSPLTSPQNTLCPPTSHHDRMKEEKGVAAIAVLALLFSPPAVQASCPTPCLLSWDSASSTYILIHVCVKGRGERQSSQINTAFRPCQELNW